MNHYKYVNNEIAEIPLLIFRRQLLKYDQLQTMIDHFKCSFM